MSNLSSGGESYHFPQLPAEIRDEFWSVCLPYRVRELNGYTYWEVFNDPSPCKMYQTRARKTRPPLISRVCHESRAIALKARLTFPFIPSPSFHAIAEARQLEEYHRCPWYDKTRVSPLLHWQSSRSSIYPSLLDPLNTLGDEAERLSERGSLMLGCFTSHGIRSGRPAVRAGQGTWLQRYALQRYARPPLTTEQIRGRDALRRVPSCQVVMQVILIHSDTAGATGLFGLFGEEVVKAVDAADEERCDAYYRLAYEVYQSNQITAPQDLEREPLVTMKTRLKRCILSAFDCEELV